MASTTPPTGAPISPLFQVLDTPNSGRAVFASCPIPANTPLWTSTDLALSVILREYRREVCGHCFTYEHGRDLRIRDQSVGHAFCSASCHAEWKTACGEIGVQAWTAVEKLIKGRSKEDSEMVEPDQVRPKSAEITKAWTDASTQASLILIARQGERDLKAVNGVEDISLANGGGGGGVQVTKQHRKAVQKALLARISPDTLSFCVCGILWKYNHPSAWPTLTALATDTTPYHSTDDLASFIRTYLHLLSILPLPLLPLVTPETLLFLSTRDSHNSFGIRSLEDEGAEFFGYGCWPSASYFNHSCIPNVEKKREGRVWCFRTKCDVDRGQELCITYLSGEERKLSREMRMRTLRRNWGFECACERCREV